MEMERALVDAFVHDHPLECLQFLETLEPDEVTSFLEEIPSSVATGLLQQMSPELAALCLARIPRGHAARFLEELPLDLGALLLRRIKETECEEIIDRMEPALARRLRSLLCYPEHLAGALMDVRVKPLFEDLTAGEAVSNLSRSRGRGGHYLYVVDRAQRLVGVLTYQQLLSRHPREPLASIMRPNVVRLLDTDTREAVRVHAGWRKFPELPVVDRPGHLLGSIPYRVFQQVEGAMSHELEEAALPVLMLQVSHYYSGSLLQLLQWSAVALVALWSRGESPGAKIHPE